jgi:two-component system, LytTR family, sensor kinase
MKIINTKYHVYYWIFDFLFHCFIHFSNFSTKINLISLGIISFNVSLKMMAFYFSLKITFPYLLDKKKPFLLLGATMLSLFLIANFGVLIDQTLLPHVEGDQTDSSDWGIDFIIRFWDLALMIPTAFVYWYAEKTIIQEHRQQEIAKRTGELEKLILQTELSNIKNQINPDLLFSTLQFFKNQAQSLSINLSRAITLLSDIMHYALHDNEQEGKVPLATELRHIQNYIEIQQLRFDNRLQITFKVMGDLTGKKIMPLILINFIENAFKHGDLNNHNSPLEILVVIEENHLLFTTNNAKRKGRKEESGMIGLENTKKRLSLGYAGCHELEIKENLNFYQICLSLTL